jgi:hypothetical protein
VPALYVVMLGSSLAAFSLIAGQTPTLKPRFHQNFVLQEWGGPSAFPSLLQLRLDENNIEGSLPTNWGKDPTSMPELVVL